MKFSDGAFRFYCFVTQELSFFDSLQEIQYVVEFQLSFSFVLFQSHLTLNLIQFLIVNLNY